MKECSFLLRLHSSSYTGAAFEVQGILSWVPQRYCLITLSVGREEELPSLLPLPPPLLKESYLVQGHPDQKLTRCFLRQPHFLTRWRAAEEERGQRDVKEALAGHPIWESIPSSQHPCPRPSLFPYPDQHYCIWWGFFGDWFPISH